MAGFLALTAVLGLSRTSVIRLKVSEGCALVVFGPIEVVGLTGDADLAGAGTGCGRISSPLAKRERSIDGYAIAAGGFLCADSAIADFMDVCTVSGGGGEDDSVTTS